MGRDVKERIELDPYPGWNAAVGFHITGGDVVLVQDRRDDPERTDRWFVEAQLRFNSEADARAFFNAVKLALSSKE